MRSIDGLTTGVSGFNALADDAATEQLSHCLQAPGWARAVLSERPYPDRETLLSTTYRLALGLTDDDLSEALSAHPRIGERPAGAGAARSRAEQSGVDARDTELAERLHAGNLAYEKKFGQVFLIRAAGRDGRQILAALAERLENGPETEARVVRDQLAQIARLRLEAMLDALTTPQ